MSYDIRVLLTEEEVDKRVFEIASQINKFFSRIFFSCHSTCK